MAITVNAIDNIINVTFDGATAWDVTTSSGLARDLPNGLSIKSIQMVPAATDNILIVRKDSATGPILFKGKAANAYDLKQVLFSTEKKHKLYVKGDEATTGVMMIIET